MAIKVPPINSAQPKTPNKQKGKLLILMDCAIHVKEGSKERLFFDEGDIVDFYKIHKKKVKACCGNPSGFSYYYVITGSNALLPVVIAKEL